MFIAVGFLFPRHTQCFSQNDRALASGIRHGLHDLAGDQWSKAHDGVIFIAPCMRATGQDVIPRIFGAIFATFGICEVVLRMQS